MTTDLKIIFDTTCDSRKYNNLVVNPNIAFVIGWENETTIQLEGVARVLDSADEDLLQTYFSVFPDGIERRKQMKNLIYFCVTPQWIRYADFNETTHVIEEMRF